MAFAHLATPPAPRTAAPEAGMQLHTRLVDMAGRQRMLSQRLVLMAVLAAQGDAASLQAGREALELFARSHQQLSRGGDGLPAPSAPALREAFFGADGADRPVLDFIELARRALGGGAAQAQAALIAQAGPMLQRLIALAALYEAQARQAAQRQQQRRAALIGSIQRIAGEARVISMNARVAAARAGHSGREFAVVAGRLLEISDEIQTLSRQAIADG
jgi:hypothetical protein